MCHSTHLTPFEREKILFFLAEGKSITEIAHLLKRSKSIILRVFRRNAAPTGHGCRLVSVPTIYRAIHAGLLNPPGASAKFVLRKLRHHGKRRHKKDSEEHRGKFSISHRLLREFFPKGKDLTDTPEEHLQRKYHELNLRPRKCLGYKTPYEVYFSKILHLA